MEQKKVEQIAAEFYPIKQSNSIMDVAPNAFAAIKQGAFIDGYTTAQQSQPMWREIEGDKEYKNVLVRKGEETLDIVEWKGKDLIRWGYTHYLSSDDLLKLPVEKK